MISAIIMPLNAYEVEPIMLRRPIKTAVDSDNIPFWVFGKCSFELADVVTHIFNCSLRSDILHVQVKLISAVNSSKSC